jgi:hypothetical protein
MVFKFKFQTIGLKTVIHGKFKELMFNIKFIFMAKSERQWTEKATKDLIGKKLKLLLQEPTILLFQAMLLLILLDLDYGNRYH